MHAIIKMISLISLCYSLKCIHLLITWIKQPSRYSFKSYLSPWMENKSKSNPQKVFIGLLKRWWRMNYTISQPHFLKNSFLFLFLTSFYSIKQSIKSLISKFSQMLGLFIPLLIFLKIPFSAFSVFSLFFHPISFSKFLTLPRLPLSAKER